MFDVPILFLIFNRPDCTEQVFERIRSIKPSKLYIAADGPRSGKLNDSELCAQCRSIIQKVDWDCEVVTLFREKNLGCKDSVSGALKWFFKQVEYGIILEDDCIPDSTFFHFCEELLLKYMHDERIGMVCGRNECNNYHIEESYNYSTAGSIWGWASWKRVMKDYDENNKDLLVNFKKNIFDGTMDRFEQSRLFHQLKWSLDGSLNTWDYQLHIQLKLSSRLYIIPKYNLIQNIGFGNDATHTRSIDKRSSVVSKPISGNLNHPKWIIPNRNLSKAIVRIDSNKLYIWYYIIVFKSLKKLKWRRSNNF
ncbi:MAG: nucleotide-diphospho-sugar transferase [Bacteroidota bacterium]